MSISLDEVSALVAKLIETDERIKRMEEKIKEVSESARVLREETIPTVMQELELKTITLTNGKRLI